MRVCEPTNKQIQHPGKVYKANNICEYYWILSTSQIHCSVFCSSKSNNIFPVQQMGVHCSSGDASPQLGSQLFNLAARSAARTHNADLHGCTMAWWSFATIAHCNFARNDWLRTFFRSFYYYWTKGASSVPRDPLSKLCEPLLWSTLNLATCAELQFQGNPWTF